MLHSSSLSERPKKNYAYPKETVALISCTDAGITEAALVHMVRTAQEFANGFTLHRFTEAIQFFNYSYPYPTVHMPEFPVKDRLKTEITSSRRSSNKWTVDDDALGEAPSIQDKSEVTAAGLSLTATYCHYFR